MDDPALSSRTLFLASATIGTCVALSMVISSSLSAGLKQESFAVHLQKGCIQIHERIDYYEEMVIDTAYKGKPREYFTGFDCTIRIRPSEPYMGLILAFTEFGTEGREDNLTLTEPGKHPLILSGDSKKYNESRYKTSRVGFEARWRTANRSTSSQNVVNAPGFELVVTPYMAECPGALLLNECVTCWNNGTAVYISERTSCNGVKNCWDGSDEENCDGFPFFKIIIIIMRGFISGFFVFSICFIVFFVCCSVYICCIKRFCCPDPYIGRLPIYNLAPAENFTDDELFPGELQLGHSSARTELAVPVDASPDCRSSSENSLSSQDSDPIELMPLKEPEPIAYASSTHPFAESTIGPVDSAGCSSRKTETLDATDLSSTSTQMATPSVTSPVVSTLASSGSSPGPSPFTPPLRSSPLSPATAQIRSPITSPSSAPAELEVRLEQATNNVHSSDEETTL